MRYGNVRMQTRYKGREKKNTRRAGIREDKAYLERRISAGRGLLFGYQDTGRPAKRKWVNSCARLVMALRKSLWRGAIVLQWEDGRRLEDVRAVREKEIRKGEEEERQRGRAAAQRFPTQRELAESASGIKQGEAGPSAQ